MLPGERNVVLGMDKTISYSWGKKSTKATRASCFPCSLGSVCLFPYPVPESVCDCDDGQAKVSPLLLTGVLRSDSKWPSDAGKGNAQGRGWQRVSIHPATLFSSDSFKAVVRSLLEGPRAATLVYSMIATHSLIFTLLIFLLKYQLVEEGGNKRDTFIFQIVERICTLSVISGLAYIHS